MRKIPRSCVRPEGVAERRDENDVRIFRMNDERADVARIFQADVFPIPAAIDRFINAVAVSDVAAQRRFAGAGVNRVVIDGATAIAPIEELILLIENRRPVRAAIGCFPNAAGDAPK